MLTTLLFAAAESDPTSDASAAAGIASTVIAGGSLALAGVTAFTDRRRRSGNDRELARRLASRLTTPEQVYLEMIESADQRSGRAFLVCLISGVLGAATVIGGAATGLLFGNPDVGAFTAICGTLPTALAGLLGKMSSAARREAKEYFDQLAASRERDQHVERALRVAKEIRNPDKRAAFLAANGLAAEGGGTGVPPVSSPFDFGPVRAPSGPMPTGDRYYGQTPFGHDRAPSPQGTGPPTQPNLHIGDQPAMPDSPPAE